MEDHRCEESRITCVRNGGSQPFTDVRNRGSQERRITVLMLHDYKNVLSYYMYEDQLTL